MTELQDQLDVLPRNITSTAADSDSQLRAKRRSGSLSTMLLPELQALAGSLGITAGKQRKSDLINAIQTAQAPSAPPAAAARATDASPAADAGPAADAVAPRTTRTRRVATRGAGSAAGTAGAGSSDDAASGATAAPQLPVESPPAVAAGTEADGGGAASADEPRTRRSRGERTQSDRNGTDRNAADRNTADRNTADRNAADRNGADRNGADRNGADRNGADRNSADRNGFDRNATDRNSIDRNVADRNSTDRNSTDRNSADRAQVDRPANRNGRDNSRPQGGSPSGQPSDNRDRQAADNRGDQKSSDRNNRPLEDDDEFGGSRRSRRYRDRRGRTRDRFETSATGRPDAEPTVSDDDVLIPVAGILDNVDDKNAWFIRVNGYFASSDDIYVANSHVRRYGLRRGDAVTGAVKQSRDGERKEKFNPLVRLDTVNGVDPEASKNRVEFTKLTPLYPQERLRLETEPNILTTRIIDLVMPLGKGQRALIVSPPKAGKTSVLQAIANAIAVNNPECHLMVVLVDERPEEVTDMQRSVKGEVIASTFDRKPSDHTMIAELSIERAKRLVEMGHDVVVLLDSITRLGRAYNLAAPASGRILSGGVDSTALYPPKRFLGAARNIEHGGSLTIIATALVETGSTMDTVIFEEFKGTGNAELILDRKIADKRTFPAVDVDRSGTRKEEILMSAEEMAVVLKLRRVLHALEPQQGIDLLLDRLKRSRTNIEFLMQISKTAPGSDDR